jgi:signal transduction histidine kinase
MDTLDTKSKANTKHGTDHVAGKFTISLVSRDLQLLELCREAVRRLSLERNDVALLDPDQAQSVGADLLVWDIDKPNWRPRPRTVAANQEQLFLVSRKDLTEFLTRMPFGAGSTLLKPLNSRTLQIFVEQVVARKRDRVSASTDSAASDVLQCLLMANLKLQEYDHDRSNFLARAVHDFRTPLMAASGYCSILLEQTIGPLSDDQADLLRRIRHSVEKLGRMAAEMLELSAGRHITRLPDLRESSIETSITAALHEIEPLARDKQITLSVHLSDPEARLYLEPQQIEQVIVNLLENACKFTPKGGAIEVRGYPADSSDNAFQVEGQDVPQAYPNSYRVDVSDTGSGILPEHLENVFEEYTSYGGSHDRSGGGLGLAICKMILSAHRGKIWAENTASGARISFVLPLGQRQPGKWIEASTAQHRTPHAAAS